MKNSLFWPSHYFEGQASFSIEETKKILDDDKPASLFKFSILKSNESRLKISYEILLTQLLQLDIGISDIENKKNWINVKIRLSNILLFIFGMQLMVGLTLLVLAIIYLEHSVVKAILLLLPFIIYAIGIINFQFFKIQVVNKLRKLEIFI